MKYLSLSINGQNMPAPGGIPTGGSLTLSKALGNGITLIVVAAAMFAVFVIIRAGIEWTASGGDKEKIAHARTRITFGLIGLFLVIFSFFIVNFVMGLFQLDNLS